MTPDQLNDDEVLALLCLVRKLIVADGVVTVAEFADLHAIGAEIGADKYTRVSDRVESQPPTLTHALTLAAGVKRVESRELILGRLTDLAGADGVDPEEQLLLDQVRELWSE